NQLEREGVPIWEDLAKTLGTSVVQAQEQVKAHAITNQQILESVTASFAQYAAAAAAWNQSWAGALKAVNENTENVMEAVGRSIKGMLNTIAPLVSDVGGLIQNFADMWEKLPQPVAAAVVAFGAVVAAVAPISVAIGAAAAAATAMGTTVGALATA